ncbi:hypothetical protein ILUMI_13862 [Ignelater luminosus]|uniref:Uncharacterized protein n=1 Tax=Ignelater luminosus TaxID=2038154 RepID=A0A8K0CXP0_IGNLU|nr:hypothetical protein ILUMI_13862 [Ignelater luminosus]
MNDLPQFYSAPSNVEALRLEMSAWRTNESTKSIKDETKTRIQEEFIEKMGLQVNIVKQTLGNTNSGNASRQFFGNPSLSAQITGVDETLIQPLAVILEVISCNANIDSPKFGVYAADTAKLAVSLYL